MKKKFGELFDLWLLRLSQIAQIIVVFVALLSIWYVVIPIYQKEILSEDLAKKEKDLRNVQTSIDSLNKIQDSINISLILTNQKYDTVNNLLDLSKLKLNDLESMKNLLTSQNNNLKINLDNKLKELKNSNAEIMATYVKDFNERICYNYLDIASKLATYEVVQLSDHKIVKFNFDFSTYPIKAILESINISFTNNDPYGTGNIPNDILNNMKNYFIIELNNIGKIEPENYFTISEEYEKQSLIIEDENKSTLENHKKIYENIFSNYANKKLNSYDSANYEIEKTDERLNSDVIMLEKDRKYIYLSMTLNKNYFEYKKRDIEKILKIIDNIAYKYFNKNDNWFNLINK